MSTMAENVIVARADNCPPMLEKSQYNSWQSRMKLYVRGKEHGKDLLDLVLHGLFKYGTVQFPGTPTTAEYTRDRTYEDLTDKEKIRKECDIRATNIVLQGLQLDVYTLVNHHTVAKEIWDRVEILLKEQNSHCKNENQSCLVEPSFLPTDDPIASLNKAMAFINTIFALRYPPTNNQLKTLSNPRNQATIQDGRVTVQNVQGRQTQSYGGVVLDEEQLATDDLDAFDSDCDEAPSCFEQPIFVDNSNIDITSDNNGISYDQYLRENESEVVQDTNSSEQHDAMIMSIIKEMSSQVAKCNAVDKENKIVHASLTAELERYMKQVNIFEERQIFNLNDREKYIDSQMRKIIVKRNAKFADFETQIQKLKLQLSANVESDAVSIRLHMKFYNPLGSVPNRCCVV
ncbi:hypothetical protein Tco_0923038 [Tanacetum coccineum]|uniref:Integrase, catalytic region, zinc finger, CCHC-type, peptidase aspartic, catalytic n=1 Tax=Tanacetum coccineum TaxID=301880 RepID=A0ABQ5D706_9ASTR